MTLPGRVASGVALVAAVLLANPAGAHAASSGSSPAPSVSAPATYTAVGTKIVGANSSAGGPLLANPGQYLDTLQNGSQDTGSPGTTKYYTVVLRRGESAYFSATMVLPPQPTSGTDADIDLALTDLPQSGCELHDDDSDFETGGVIPPLSVAVATGQVGGKDWPSDCPDGGTFVVEVARTGSAYRQQAVPLELGYRIEPPADTAGQPGTASAASDVIMPNNGALQDVSAGHSFDNAPTLVSGRYQDTIASGETHYFRVPLHWGQRFSFLATSAPLSGDQSGVNAQATLSNPVRDPARLAGEGGSTVYAYDFGGTNGSINGSTAAVVRYANRTSDSGSVYPYSIDGGYFLAITLGFGNDGERASVSYTLAVTIFGAAQRGPSYAVPAGAAPGGSGGSDVALWVAVAIVAVALVAAAVTLPVRRRRRRAASPGYAPTSTAPLPGRRH